MPGRLRIINEFGKRAIESGSQNTKEVYLISIASEGKTEEQYFDGIHDLDSSEIIKVERLVKSDKTDTKSHPNHVIDLLDERKEYWEEHGIEANELWMVVDRDRQNVSKEQLNSIIDKCKLEGYNLALSNPTFEFWLLLHITDLQKYSVDDLLCNEKVNKTRRFIDKELSLILKGYSKKNLKFERFEDGINDAIIRAKKMQIRNENLIDELGTSVCLLVEKLIK
ncbi:MAG: RloB family protein [Bacteroidota bacterium]|nr:RloB family protein [Bacteroidota bacterium]